MTTALYEARQARHVGHHHPTRLDWVICDQGRSRLWVSEELEVDRSTVYRWCSGERGLPPARVRQLASLLGLDEADLIGDCQ